MTVLLRFIGRPKLKDLFVYYQWSDGMPMQSGMLVHDRRYRKKPLLIDSFEMLRPNTSPKIHCGVRNIVNIRPSDGTLSEKFHMELLKAGWRECKHK